MSDTKCFSCPAKNAIANIQDAKRCNNCQTYYHPSCFKVALKYLSSKGTMRCCPDHQPDVSSTNNQIVDREFFIAELQTLRNVLVSHADRNHEDLVNRVNKLENDVSVKFNEVTQRVDKYESKLINLEEQVALLESKQDNTSLKIEEEAIAELEDRKQRENNVIVFGLAENQTYSEDKESILEAFPSAPFSLNQFSAFRLGNRNANSTRPLKLLFKNKEQAAWMLVNSKRGTDPNIKCVHDRTPRQREQFKTVMEELNNRRENGETNITLKFERGVPLIKEKRKHQGSKNSTTINSQISPHQN